MNRDERIEQLSKELEKPAFEAASAIKGPSLADSIQDEPKVEDKQQIPEEAEETETGGKKVRIPASRLKTLTSKVDELQEQLSEALSYKERVALLESQLKQNNPEELPDWWKEAYGDSEVSRQGYKYQQKVAQEQMRTALAEMESKRETEMREREERLEAIEQSFDSQMDDLEESLGRELTATQKEELLDIIGEYSPQEDGKYTAYMSVEKAYDIWQKGQGVSPAKTEMARIAGASSQGDSASSTPGPIVHGSWRKKYGW